MPAYMVAFVRIDDIPSFTKIYLEKAAKLVEKHGGSTVAVSENPTPLEGSIPEGRLVILEFPSSEAAEGFYNDPEYQPLKAARRQISSSDSTIITRGF